MKNLQEATDRISELSGRQVALDALLPAVIDALRAPSHARLIESFDSHADAARASMLHADIPDIMRATFERDVARNRALLQRSGERASTPAQSQPVDDLLLSVTRISTFAGSRALTSASGFFFRRKHRLFLVSNRHVFEDVPTAHFPDRIEIGVHTDLQDLRQYVVLPLPLHRGGRKLWREAPATAGSVDVVAIEIPPEHLPRDAAFAAFDEAHLDAQGEEVAIGDALTIAGFPLGFHDTVHYLAVARGACVASAFGVRFQREACFLTDARTHSGSSGSPVVRRRAVAASPLSLHSWRLLGVHSTRMDMRTRDRAQDESLGLNCAWYADVLTALTAEG